VSTTEALVAERVLDFESGCANERCDAQTVSGVVTLAGGESLVSDSPVWRRRTWELSRATRVLQSLSEAQQGVTLATLRFSMRGPGQCQLDWVSYRVSAVVCTAHESIRQQCCRLSTAETTPSGDGGATGR
jgi:hypothetical protein